MAATCGQLLWPSFLVAIVCTHTHTHHWGAYSASRLPDWFKGDPTSKGNGVVKGGARARRGRKKDAPLTQIPGSAAPMVSLCVLMQLREKLVVTSIRTINKPMIGGVTQTTVISRLVDIVMDTYHRVCRLAPPICSVERC